MANLHTVPNLGAKYLLFVSSRFVKMRELNFPQKVNKLSKAKFSWQVYILLKSPQVNQTIVLLVQFHGQKSTCCWLCQNRGHTIHSTYCTTKKGNMEKSSTLKIIIVVETLLLSIVTVKLCTSQQQR